MRRGFTLIEMLVVTVIVATLAAILFPVYARTKLQSKRTVAVSQLKQIGSAITIYTTDWDGTLMPRKIIGAGGFSASAADAINPDYQDARHKLGQTMADQLFGLRTRNVAFYSQILYPYSKSREIFVSPGNPFAWTGSDPTGTYVQPMYRSYGAQNSYGINLYLTSEDTDWGPSGGRNEDTIKDGASTLMVVDAGYYTVLPQNPHPISWSSLNVCKEPQVSYWKNLGNSTAFFWDGTSIQERADSNAKEAANSRYAGLINILFVDTHASTKRLKAMLRDENLDMWSIAVDSRNPAQATDPCSSVPSGSYGDDSNDLNK